MALTVRLSAKGLKLPFIYRLGLPLLAVFTLGKIKASVKREGESIKITLSVEESMLGLLFKFMPRFSKTAFGLLEEWAKQKESKASLHGREKQKRVESSSMTTLTSLAIGVLVSL